MIVHTTFTHNEITNLIELLQVFLCTLFRTSSGGLPRLEWVLGSWSRSLVMWELKRVASPSARSQESLRGERFLIEFFTATYSCWRCQSSCRRSQPLQCWAVRSSHFWASSVLTSTAQEGVCRSGREGQALRSDTRCDGCYRAVAHLMTLSMEWLDL